MPLTHFHPAVASWFEKRFGAPTEPQARAWPEIRAGRHTLIAAPTGSGKTLAAFLSAIDDLVRQALVGNGLPDETEVVYVSPLKALSNDVEKNLEEPLAGIRRELAAMGLPDAGDPHPGAHRGHAGLRCGRRWSSGRPTSWSPRRSRCSSCSPARAGGGCCGPSAR